MKRFIWILLVLFLSVCLGVVISKDPGYALFVYRQWSLETPLWFFFLCTLVFIFLLYGLFQFFNGIEATWLRLKNWLRLHRQYKAYGKTNRGVAELLEGEWENAEYHLLEGVKKSDTPFVNYMAAAWAAHEQKQYDKRDLYLQKAHAMMPSAEIAIGITEAQFQMAQGQLEQARATLTNLRKIAPKHKRVLHLLEKLYIRLADWHSLLPLLPALRKAKLITSEQEENFAAHLYQELLKNLKVHSRNVADYRALWHEIPRQVKKNPELIACYVKKMLTFSDTAEEVADLLVGAVKNQWHEPLGYYYGLAVTSDSKHQLSVAEGWLKKYGYHAALFLTLGRLCMRCQLWGKARSYLEQSLKADPKPETYLEYGKLLEQLGEKEAASLQYRQGLSRVSE